MSDPAPPPPPPSMAPPPGYAGYSGTDFRSGGLRRVRGLSLGIIGAMIACALSSLLVFATTGTVKDASEDFLSGRINADDYDKKLAGFGLGGGLGFVGLVAGLVLTVIWLYRMISNHRTLGRAVFWAPLWAIFGWVLPPFLFVIPALIVVETWKAADPDAPLGTDSWKRSGIGLPVIVWFALFGIARTIASFLTGSPFDQFSRDREDVAQRFVDHAGGVAIQAAVDVLGAAAWVWVVWSLTQRHSRLTGEATAR